VIKVRIIWSPYYFFKVIKTLDTGKIPQRKPTNVPQLFFTISEGCSKIRLEDYAKFFGAICRSFEELGPFGKKLVAFCIVFALVGLMAKDGASLYFDHLEKTNFTEIFTADRQAEREHVERLVLSENMKTTMNYANNVRPEIRKSFIKNTPVNEVDSIKFPTETLSKDQIIEEQQQTHIETRAAIETHEFKILNLSGSFTTKKLRAKVQLIDDPKVQITLTSELFDEEYDSELESEEEHLLQESDIDILWEAQKHNKNVEIWGNFVYDQSDKLMKGVMWTIKAKE